MTSSVNSNSREVISMCSRHHLDVWKWTSSLVPQFIQATSYTVFVPEDEIEVFARVTDPRIKVKSQDSLGKPYRNKLMEKLIHAQNEGRYGWYLQQFMKIEALLSSSSEQAVIWDSDCVPLRPIQTFDLGGRAVYMKASAEDNSAYFDCIFQLTGLRKIVDFSFVIPACPTYISWVQAFSESLKKSDANLSWYDSLLANIDFSLQSGFSETETLGTWISHKYPELVTTSFGRWERRGQKRFGYAKNMNNHRLASIHEKFGLDIVTFENWDVRGLRLIKKRLLEKTSLTRFFKTVNRG